MLENPLLNAQLKPRNLWQTIGFFTPLGFKQTRLAKKRFLQIAGPDELIDFKEWQTALGLSNPLIAKRLFHLVDTDTSGFIDLQEYLIFVNCLVDKKSDRRFELLFAIYDQDSDGQLQLKDIQQLLEASLQEQSLKVSQDDLVELARSFLSYFEGAKKNKLDLETFIQGIKTFPRIDRLIQQFVNQWLSRSNKQKAEQDALQIGLLKRYQQHFKSFWHHYVWLIAYLVFNDYLFIHAMNIYAEQGAFIAVQIARGLGACLNFNAALILLLMARGFWSSVRHTFFHYLIPIDSLTDFHRYLGWIIVLISIGHAAAHIYNYWYTDTDPFKLVFDLSFLTGVLASLGLLVIVVGAFFRTKRKREIFSIAHYAYVIFLVGTLLHGQHFWLWLTAPLVIYTLDALYRTLFKTRTVKIIDIKPLSDGVTWVRFEKPKRFKFQPGDFLFLKIKQLSRFQWHPFTLSAAPEATYFDLHIRNNGNWSGALHNLSRKPQLQLNELVAQIDGPYGAPTTHISQSKVAVMVAAGIGVTPFASALESLVFQKSASAEKQTQQFIYFHWLNRSQASYEWFQKLLTDAEQVLKDQFKLFIHLTSFNHNLTNIAMQIAVDEFYKKHVKDPFTQLQAITNPGRPNWSRLFTDLLSQHPHDTIDVYFCGPKELGNDVEKHCNRFGFRFFREKFD